MDSFDVIVIGGGPAGMTAALYLARAQKRTLLLDAGKPRNAVAEHTHGLLGFDGRSPADIRAAGRETLAKYDTVVVRDVGAAGMERSGSELVVSLSDGTSARARKILLATGVVDVLPKHAGLRERFGASIFACPYCHGHEVRGKRWGALISAKAVVGTVSLYKAWTPHVIALLDGRTDLEDRAITAMTSRGVSVEPRKIVAFHGPDRSLTEVELEGGERLALDAMMIAPPKRQSDVVLMAGLTLDEQGFVKANDELETSMRGVFVCGDAAGLRPHSVIAAADGATAGMHIAEALTLEDAPR